MKVIPVLILIGWLLIILAGAMLTPVAVAMAYGEPEQAVVFTLSAALTLFAGGALILATRGTAIVEGRTRDMTLIAMIWTILPIFSALPFFGGSTLNSLSGAYFEAVSGFTTTGATLFQNLDEVPRSMIFWRALLQWLGGIATLITAGLMIDPSSRGGVQDMRYLFPESGRRALRVRQAIQDYVPLYSVFTLACFVALNLAGIAPFDALCLAFSTLSTGGFMPRSGTLEVYQAPYLYGVIWIFMMIGATSFFAHRAVFTNLSFSRHRENRETIYLLTICFAGGLLLSLPMLFEPSADNNGFIANLSFNIFAISSLVTTTGFLPWNTAPASVVLPYTAVLMLCLMGGAMFSTAGGLKLMRVALLFKLSGRELAQLIHPHGITLVNIESISSDAKRFHLVWMLFAILLILLAVISLLVSLSGVRFDEALLAAAAALSNTGPVFDFQNTSGYAGLPENARLPLIVAMILGRIEFLAIIGMINISFWQR